MPHLNLSCSWAPPFPLLDNPFHELTLAMRKEKFLKPSLPSTGLLITALPPSILQPDFKNITRFSDLICSQADSRKHVGSRS